MRICSALLLIIAAGSVAGAQERSVLSAEKVPISLSPSGGNSTRKTSAMNRPIFLPNYDLANQDALLRLPGAR